jgi:uncharacterized protein (DUF1810 family)
MPEVDLRRFFDAQRDTFDRALGEIEAGRKTSHWMWFVLPQMSGLGLSSMSVRYAINTLAEVEEFLADPILGSRYRQIVDAVWHQVVERGVTIHQLFGSPDDSKLVSSLTLFAAVADDPDFVANADQILAAANGQGLGRCATTERFIADDPTT